MAVVGLPVLTHKTAAIQAKNHRQVGKTNIMDDLVKSPLEEGGVNGHHRLESFCGQSGRKSDGVLFGDPHVQKAFRIELSKLIEPGPFRHGRSNGK